MGVRRLQTFVEQDPSVFFDVDLKELIDAYIKEKNKKPVIVLDLLAALSESSKISSLSGGQTKEIKEKIVEFYRRFEDLGAEVVAFADGAHVPSKEETKNLRDHEKINLYVSIYQQLKSDPLSFHEGYYKQPYLSRISVFFFLLTNNKAYIRSLLDCDLEMAKFAEENDCFAIMAQDSDFLIYPGIRHYLSINHFNMENMTTKEYSQKNLAKKLNLEIEQLPILASLIANDVIQQEELTKFHLSMSDTRFRVDSYQNFFKVANVISNHFARGLTYDETLDNICAEAFGTANYPKFRLSLQIYDTKYPHQAHAIDETFGEGWMKVQKMARDLLIEGKIMAEIYNVIVGLPIYFGPIMEDINQKPFLPASVLMMKMHKRMYGVLLQEKPLLGKKQHEVVERHLSGFDFCEGTKKVEITSPKRRYLVLSKRKLGIVLSKQFRERVEMTLTLSSFSSLKLSFDTRRCSVFVLAKHSGLVNLWTANDVKTNAEKISLFQFCLGIGKQITNLEERHFILPTAAMKYLIAQGFSILKWELEALVISMVLVDCYSVERLQEIPEFPIDTRAMNLYQVFAEGCISTLRCIQSCGFPFKMEECDPSRYHDGKLFQLKYRQSKSKSSTFKELCENNDSVVATSKKLIAILRK